MQCSTRDRFQECCRRYGQDVTQGQFLIYSECCRVFFCWVITRNLSWRVLCYIHVNAIPVFWVLDQKITGKSDLCSGNSFKLAVENERLHYLGRINKQTKKQVEHKDEQTFYNWFILTAYQLTKIYFLHRPKSTVCIVRSYLMFCVIFL